MCLMKKIMKSFTLLAVAALGLSACNDDKLVPDNGNADGKFVTVHFGAEAAIEGATKATLTPDGGETAFQAAWENGDELKVKYSNDSGIETATGTTTATWKSTSFESTMPEYTGMWIYDAAYPVPASDNSVDFGPNRTQKGNAYNSKYDIMIGSAVAKNAAAGKDKTGKDIVFMMTRQTAIAYFHFTSDLNEAVTSATLTVSGEGSAIASNYAYVSDFAWAPAKDCQSITITFPEEAPNAQDFQLWFNVLETKYSSMSLTVETATKRFTISKNTAGEYVAGKLYKVKKSGIAWTDKGGSSTPATHVSVVNVDNVNAVLAMGNGSYGDYKDIVQTITVDGLEYSMTNICANSKNGQDGYLMAAKQFIQMKKSTSYIFNTKNGVTNIKAWVLPATTNAISVYQGSTSDNISTLINKPNKTTETVKLISNLDSEVDTQLDIYEYTITDGFFKLAPSAPLWLYKLEVTYSNSGSSEPAPDTYSVSCATVTGGTLSASPVKAEAGAEVTLTATPDAGYEFNNDWTVKDADGAKIDVYDGKFTMPAANVTVSATFVEAAAVPVYASVAELIAAGKPTEKGTKVTVTLKDEEITKFYKPGTFTNGVYFMVGTQEVEIYCKDVPESWVIGGYVSGTLTNCTWKLYNSTWELCPSDYSELTYKAPLPTCATPVITIAEDGVVSITCDTAGATIHYTVGDAPDDPTEADAVFSAVTLTDGQTIKAIAVAEGYKPSAVASEKYTVGGEAHKTYTLTFGKDFSDTNVNGYTTTWDATRGGFTWTMVNWNNNNNYNNSWTYVKAGPKGNTNAHAMISTKFAMPEAISRISIIIDKVENGSITSIVLKSSSTNDFTAGTVIETKSSVVQGEVVFEIPSPQKGLYYQLDFTLNNTTPNSDKGKNGVALVSKVVYTNN